MCVACVDLLLLGGWTNLCLPLCTRSSTTLRERTTRQTCPPWPRPPPRTGPRSTSSPSQRCPCPSPNNLADPVRNHKLHLLLFCKKTIFFPIFPSSFLCRTPSHPQIPKNKGWTVCEHSSCVYVGVSPSSHLNSNTFCVPDSSRAGRQQV